MNSIKTVLILLVVCTLAGCGRDNARFEKTVFTEPNSGNTITLNSDKECEIKQGRDILLAEYSRQENKLRVVLQAFGTSQVLYYDITPEGLRDSGSGAYYLLPEPLSNWREQVRIAKEAEETRRRDEEARKQRAAEERRRKQEELARRVLDSKTPTKVLETYSCSISTPNGDKTQQIKITDVDVTFLDNYGNKTYTAWYGYISDVRFDPGFPDYIQIIFKRREKELNNNSSMLIPFSAEVNPTTIVQTINQATAAWQSKFPDLSDSAD